MVETAYSALREVDVTLFMISADQKRGRAMTSLSSGCGKRDAGLSSHQ